MSSGFFLMGFGFFVGSAKVLSDFCKLSKFFSVTNDDGSHASMCTCLLIHYIQQYCNQIIQLGNAYP